MYYLNPELCTCVIIVYIRMSASPSIISYNQHVFDNVNGVSSHNNETQFKMPICLHYDEGRWTTLCSSLFSSMHPCTNALFLLVIDQIMGKLHLAYAKDRKRCLLTQSLPISHLYRVLSTNLNHKRRRGLGVFNLTVFQGVLWQLMHLSGRAVINIIW